MELTTALISVGSLAGGILGGFKVYDAIMQRVWRNRKYRAELKAYEDKHRAKAMVHVPPDPHGRLGMMFRPGGAVNLDTYTELDEKWRVKYYQPLYEKLVALERLVLASGRNGGQSAQETPWGQMLEQGVPQLPNKISLQDTLGMHAPSLSQLVLGVTLDGNGQTVPIMRSLSELMHLLAIGITGAGKSTWLLAFLAQLAACPEDVDVILIDVHGSAFNACAKWSKLLYPIVRNVEQAKAVLDAVHKETERRAQLYQELPMADDLPTYNLEAAKVGLPPLKPGVTVIDEGTILLSNKSIGRYINRALHGSRQYGNYVFVTGHSANATVVETVARPCFLTRMAMMTEKRSMAIALGEAPPEELPDIPGRAWVRMRGSKTPILMQAPYIRRSEFYQMLDRGGPKNSMPEVKGEKQDWTKEQLRKIWDDLATQNKSEMCRALWEEMGKEGPAPTGGAHWGEVDQLGKWAGLWG